MHCCLLASILFSYHLFPNPHVLLSLRYGLLGSSGCGKTTLLRCILGRLQLASGSVLVFGRQPGTMGHNVPGRGVGYMPQVRKEDGG